MPESVVTVTPSKWHDSHREFMTGTIAIAAGDYTAGGIGLAFRTLADWKGTNEPDFVKVVGISGYFYEWDRANKKLIIRQQRDPAAAGGADIPFTELAGAAMPTAVVADTINFFAVGRGLI